MDINALFLGPKSENETFFRNMLQFMIDDHLSWRKYFHPDDQSLSQTDTEILQLRQETFDRTRDALLELAANLQTGSVPWFSPRYLGHMTTDTLMAASLGYMLTLLYNPNNCAYEASPATTPMEIEAGRQLAVMMGYPAQTAWGHITSGGTVANYEAMWIARNLRSMSFAIKKVTPLLVADLNDWQLANLTNHHIMDMLDEVKKAGKLEAVRDASVRGLGIPPGGLGKWLVPQSKHYSWVKAADILGIGQHQLEFIRVKDDYRMDVDDMKRVIDKLISNNIAVLGAVAVVGTTEEGAVDELDKVIALRNDYHKQGVWFHVHVDAAYGGYVRTAFLNEDSTFMSYDEARKQRTGCGSGGSGAVWPDLSVYQAFKAMKDADSITVDPHKMGYVPYAAGAFLMPDRRALDAISYFAAYVFEKEEKNPMLLGSYIMEGSKAGAVAASVWTAHQVVPLNNKGYGKLIRNSIEGAFRFYHSLKENHTIKAGKQEYNVHCLCKPDINIIIYAFNQKGNTSLEKMNELNHKIYEQFSYRSGPIYASDYIMSKTTLTQKEYGDMPAAFVQQSGIPLSAWEEVKEVFVLRSCIMTPLLAQEKYKEYWNNFISVLKEKLAHIETVSR